MDDALSGGCPGPQEEREDREADVEHIGPRRKTQINVCCRVGGGMRTAS